MVWKPPFPRWSRGACLNPVKDFFFFWHQLWLSVQNLLSPSPRAYVLRLWRFASMSWDKVRFGWHLLNSALSVTPSLKDTLWPVYTREWWTQGLRVLLYHSLALCSANPHAGLCGEPGGNLWFSWKPSSPCIPRAWIRARTPGMLGPRLVCLASSAYPAEEQAPRSGGCDGASGVDHALPSRPEPSGAIKVEHVDIDF